MKWEKGRRNTEIADSEMEEDSTIVTSSNEEDLQRRLGQRGRNMLGMNWKLTKEKDTEMKKAGKVA